LASALVAGSILAEQKLFQEVGVAGFFFSSLLSQCRPIRCKSVEFELLVQ
jgi:hypothetical protein